MIDIDTNSSRSVDDVAAAAVLLLIVEEAEAAAILERLKPEEVRILGAAMYGVVDVGEGEILTVLDNFVERARNRNMLAHGAHGHLQAAMHRALGPEKAGVMMDRIAPPSASSDALAQLQWLEADAIAALLAPQHPQLAALALSYLPTELTADVVALLPESDQEDLLFRVATLGPVSAAVIAEVEQILLQSQTARKPTATQKRGGTSDAAAILNNLQKPADARILKSLNKRDKNIARMVEDEMFIFDDLAKLDDRTLGTILRSADSTVLVPALKGADEKLRKRMLGAMSKRAAQSIADDITESGPLPRSDVHTAQRAIILVAKKLAADGAITLGGKGDDLV